MAFTIDDLAEALRDTPCPEAIYEDTLLPTTREFVRQQYAKEDIISQIFRVEPIDSPPSD